MKIVPCLRRLLTAAVLCGAVSCASATAGQEACLTCHRDIEPASATHDGGCVACHGGDSQARDKSAAHRAMHGAADGSSPAGWEQACGTCHRHQLERVRSSQMFTNAGMIAQIQATWEGERSGRVFGARAAGQNTPQGQPIVHTSVANLDHLSGELYRKSCAGCHLATPNLASDGAGHGGGCAACHFPYASDAIYRGRDRKMHGIGPASATHAMQGLPPPQACAQCHHRSGRASLSYQGLMDGNNALAPTSGGLPGPVRASDERSLTHIAPDVHFTAGMECIDCHTSREIMGDGYAAGDMHGQLEIRCQDCHGDGERPPVFATAARESEDAIRESRQYRVPVRPGTRMALTGKGRPYSNVFEQDGAVLLATKRAGRLLRSPVITGTPEHRIAGHERLACSTCHSRTVPQCYGCHTTYDKRTTGWDLIRDEETDGGFTETEDYRTLYPFPIALNARGQISPVTPGCQTFVTVIEEDGRASRREYVAVYKGKPQLRFASFYGHSTGTRAIGCTECHGDPAFLGFGQHVVERGAIKSTLLCEKNDKKALDGFLSMEHGRVVSHAAITRTGARPLNHDEVRRTLSVNLCLVCHDSARDPIYRSRLDYDALGDRLHLRLLAAGR